MITLDNEMTKAFLGSTEVKKICLGSEQVWPVESALPYDAEIEYLQTDGNAYINTGLLLDSNDEVSARIYMPSKIASKNIFGAGGYSNTSEPCIGVYTTSTGNISWVFCNTSNRRNNSGTTGWHTGVMNKTNMRLNGTLKSGAMSGSFVLSTPLLLFGGYIWDYPAVTGSRISYLAVKDKLDLIPVRKGSVGYMYDKVSGQLFGNAGTGSFILGNDVN